MFVPRLSNPLVSNPHINHPQLPLLSSRVSLVYMRFLLLCSPVQLFLLLCLSTHVLLMSNLLVLISWGPLFVSGPSFFAFLPIKPILFCPQHLPSNLLSCKAGHHLFVFCPLRCHVALIFSYSTTTLPLHTKFIFILHCLVQTHKY